MPEEGDFYTPQEAARLLARTDKPISERSIRQMLQTEELKGVRDDQGQWYVEQVEVHRLMEERREAASQETRESPQSAAGFIEIACTYGPRRARERHTAPLVEEDNRWLRRTMRIACCG